jgi:capsular polysaccharide biosynthesis protein
MRNIRIFFKNIYKYWIRLFFKALYGHISCNLQNVPDPGVVIKKIESKHIIDLKNNNYCIYNVVGGKIYTDYVENVAIINKQNIVNKASFQQIDGQLKTAEFNCVINNGTPSFQKKIDGNILSLTQGASGHKNYFHWLFDILPKIKIFSEGQDLQSIDYFYLAKLQPYQKKTLEILKLDHIKILDCNKYRHIIGDQVFSVDHPWYQGGYISEEAKNLSNWIVPWINKKFLPYAEYFESNEKIFLDRSESPNNHCQIENNNEVIDFLNKNGFTSYKVGQLSFEQQIHLFKNAKIIVGAHGAAFANLAFCSPGTQVIEIKPIHHPNYVSKTIGKINDLKVKIIETPKFKSYNINLDINELNKNL